MNNVLIILAPSFVIGSSSFLQVTRTFNWIFFILAGNKDNHKISDGVKIRPD